MNVIVLLSCLCLIHCSLAAETKIPLSTSNAINGFGAPDASTPPTPAQNMLDEQTIAGDPANGSPGAPNTTFFPGWTSWYYPDVFYLIDFEATYTITSVWLFTDWGQVNVNFRLGSDIAHWTYNWTFNRSGQGWVNFTVNAQNVRWFQVQFLQSSGDAMKEFVFYGTKTAAAEPKPQTRALPLPLMKNFIGTNIFWIDPIDKIAAVGVAREYHDWGWDEGNGDPSYQGYPNSQNKFEPAYPANDWLFDTFYSNAKNAGVDVHHCMQKTAPYLKNNDGSRTGEKPLTDDQMKTPGAAEVPANYAAHADHAYQLAARYGKQQHPTSDLKLASDQPVKSGLNLLNWLEFWNEQDAWWAGRADYFNPWEYSAMLSADYDAHLGTMDKTIGVKNADPNTKVVMGGIANYNFGLDYLRSMKAWTDSYRNKSFPAEALNVHHYCNNGNSGISPEADQFAERAKVLTQWRDANLPNTELWISEWGWDTNQGSSQKAPAIGSTSGDVVQAQWIIRAYLLLASAGVDRTHHFMLHDTDGGYGTYASSGLVSAPQYAPAYTPKISWYYVYTLKNRIGEMSFVKISTSSQGPMIAVFQKSDKSSTCYAVWSPTSANTVVNDFTVTLDSGGSTDASVLLVNFAVNQTNGVETKVAVSSGAVKVNVSETPVLIIA